MSDVDASEFSARKHSTLVGSFTACPPNDGDSGSSSNCVSSGETAASSWFETSMLRSCFLNKRQMTKARYMNLINIVSLGNATSMSEQSKKLGKPKGCINNM